jgi:hypothetical protein
MSGISQYMESLPSSDGPRYTAKPVAAAAVVSAPAAKAVQSGGAAEAKTLLRIASDPAFAAPRKAVAPANPEPKPKGGGAAPVAKAQTIVAGTGADASVAGAAGGALGGSWLLLGGLAAVALIVAGAVRARGEPRRDA